MGQAKYRGTYNQRKAEAEEQNYQWQLKIMQVLQLRPSLKRMNLIRKLNVMMLKNKHY